MQREDTHPSDARLMGHLLMIWHMAIGALLVLTVVWIAYGFGMIDDVAFRLLYAVAFTLSMFGTVGYFGFRLIDSQMRFKRDNNLA